MFAQCLRYRRRGVERGELAFIEANAVAILERKDHFHMLERIPLRHAASNKLNRLGFRQFQNHDQQLAYFAFERRGAACHVATSTFIAGEIVFARTTSKSASTLV